MKAYKKIPVIAEFTDNDGNDILHETIDSNYRRVKQEIIALVESETERIKNDPELNKLVSILFSATTILSAVFQPIK